MVLSPQKLSRVRILHEQVTIGLVGTRRNYDVLAWTVYQSLNVGHSKGKNPCSGKSMAGAATGEIVLGGTHARTAN